MLSNPRINQSARVHYRASAAPHMPHHGKAGKVVVVSRGKPRSHGVEIDGVIVCVHCGNLKKMEP